MNVRPLPQRFSPLQVAEIAAIWTAFGWCETLPHRIFCPPRNSRWPSPNTIPMFRQHSLGAPQGNRTHPIFSHIAFWLFLILGRLQMFKKKKKWEINRKNNNDNNKIRWNQMSLTYVLRMMNQRAKMLLSNIYVRIFIVPKVYQKKKM